MPTLLLISLLHLNSDYHQHKSLRLRKHVSEQCTIVTGQVAIRPVVQPFGSVLAIYHVSTSQHK